MWPVARNAFREAVRDRALYNLVLFVGLVSKEIERRAHLGRLDDLRQRVDSAGHLEITITGGAAERLRGSLAKVEGARMEATSGGVRIEVADERDEDLFVTEGPRATHTD